jgi:nitrous oxide reductase accessory protein NosL
MQKFLQQQIVKNNSQKKQNVKSNAASTKNTSENRISQQNGAHYQAAYNTQPIRMNSTSSKTMYSSNPQQMKHMAELYSSEMDVNIPAPYLHAIEGCL